MNDNNICPNCSNMCDETELETVYKFNHSTDAFEENLICEYCLANDDRIFYCNFHHRYEVGVIKEFVHGYGYVCCETLSDEDNGFCFCEDCNNWFDDEDCVFYDEDYYVCPLCQDKYSVIGKYHYHQDEYSYNKLRCVHETDKEKLMFYGMEIEIEGINSELENIEMAKKLMNPMNSHFVCEYDSSLGNGFEIISYPFSKDFMDEYLKEDLKQMLKIIKENKYGIKDTCGLHFHLSAVNWDTTLNFVCLVEYFKEEFELLSKRGAYELKKWASFYTHEPKRFLRKENIKKSLSFNKYRAVNLCKEETVEVRFFKGTVNFEELMARYEMIYNIYEYSRENELSESLKDIPNFYEVVTYKSDEYVTDYLENEFPEIMLQYRTLFLH